MKRVLASAAVVGLFATVTIISNSPLKGDDNDRNRGDREREDEGELEVQTGFRIIPPNIKLNLKGKDIELVDLLVIRHHHGRRTDQQERYKG